MDRMASVIDLQQWKGYRGDMGSSERHTYYNKWQGIDGTRLIFHPTTPIYQYISSIFPIPY